MPKRPMRIHSFADGTIAVAGTSDVAEARRTLAAAGVRCTCDPRVLEVHDCTPAATGSAWYRMVPGPRVWQGVPDQDVRMIPARSRAGGAFQAVTFL